MKPDHSTVVRNYKPAKTVLQAELEAIYDSAPVGLCVFDTNLRYLRINERLAEINGVPVSDHIGRTVREVLPDLADQAEAITAKIIETGLPVLNIEFTGTTSSQPGVLRTWLENWFPIKDGSGRVFAINVVADEITERKRAEEALRESEAQLKRSQEIAQLGSWELDLVNNRLTWSDEVYKIFGLQPQEFAATYEAFLAAVHPDDRAAVDAAYSDSVRDGKNTYEIEHRVVKKSTGEIRSVHEKCEHIRDASGRIIRSFGMVHDITERKRTEEALREAHDRALRLARFPDENPNPVARVSADGSVLYCNPSALELPGWTCDVGWPVDPRLLPLVRRAMAEGQEEQEDVQIGRMFYSVWAVPFPEEGYANLYGRDITERKRAEDALRNREAQLRTILENLAQGVVVSDLNGGFLYWNPASLEMHGFRSVEECLGSLPEFTDIFELSSIDGEVLPFEQWPLSRILRGEHLSNWEIRVRRIKSDWQRVFSYGGNLACDSSGQALMAVVTVNDITDRKRDEEALRRAKDEWERTFDAVPDLIAILDDRHRVMRANRAMTERLGRAPDECAGLPCFAAVHGTDRPPAFCPHTRTLADCREHTAEVHEDRLGGYFLVSTTPICDEQGRLIGSIHVARDITERRQMEEELRKSRDELQLRVEERTAELEKANAKLKRSYRRLEELNKDLQDFAFVASHDLQEPLRKIQSFGDMLAARFGTSMDETSRDYLNRMHSAASRMQKLIESLLSYSRVATRAEPITDTDLKKSVEEALSNLEIMIREKSARMEVGDLPTVQADRVQMIQLFQNLIGNALKYQPEGEAPRVKIRSRKAGDAKGVWEILVEDNGIGFEEKYLDRIFLPFHRLHGRSSEYEGVGMGLAICKKIVERHGGEITAKSELGRGTTFIVTLPVGRKTR